MKDILQWFIHIFQMCSSQFCILIGLHDHLLLVQIYCCRANQSISMTLLLLFLKGKKVKVKLSLHFFLTEHHAIKAYWGSGGISPRILDLGTRWRWVVRFMPWPLYPQGKNPWYPMNMRLGGLQSWSGHGGEKNSQSLLGLKPPITQPVAPHCNTELSHLLLFSLVFIKCTLCIFVQIEVTDLTKLYNSCYMLMFGTRSHWDKMDKVKFEFHIKSDLYWTDMPPT
jgi:hypothetical protein